MRNMLFVALAGVCTAIAAHSVELIDDERAVWQMEETCWHYEITGDIDAYVLL